jgi:hypothetical protein
MAKLFVYTITYHPKVTKDRDGNETQGPGRILVDPTPILANNEKEVIMRAARRIPEDLFKKLEEQNKLEEVDIIVRPF